MNIVIIIIIVIVIGQQGGATPNLRGVGLNPTCSKETLS